MTPRQQDKLRAWFAAEHTAGRLRMSSVHMAAERAEAALGFGVAVNAAGAAWQLAEQQARRRAPAPQPPLGDAEQPATEPRAADARGRKPGARGGRRG